MEFWPAKGFAIGAGPEKAGVGAEGDWVGEAPGVVPGRLLGVDDGVFVLFGPIMF